MQNTGFALDMGIAIRNENQWSTTARSVLKTCLWHFSSRHPGFWV